MTQSTNCFPCVCVVLLFALYLRHSQPKRPRSLFAALKFPKEHSENGENGPGSCFAAPAQIPAKRPFCEHWGEELFKKKCEGEELFKKKCEGEEHFKKKCVSEELTAK